MNFISPLPRPHFFLSLSILYSFPLPSSSSPLFIYVSSFFVFLFSASSSSPVDSSFLSSMFSFPFPPPLFSLVFLLVWFPFSRHSIFLFFFSSVFLQSFVSSSLHTFITMSFHTLPHISTHLFVDQFDERNLLLQSLSSVFRLWCDSVSLHPAPANSTKKINLLADFRQKRQIAHN